jgi:hypothetical protein
MNKSKVELTDYCFVDRFLAWASDYEEIEEEDIKEVASIKKERHQLTTDAFKIKCI